MPALGVTPLAMRDCRPTRERSLIGTPTPNIPPIEEAVPYLAESEDLKVEGPDVLHVVEIIDSVRLMGMRGNLLH